MLSQLVTLLWDWAKVIQKLWCWYHFAVLMVLDFHRSLIRSSSLLLLLGSEHRLNLGKSSAFLNAFLFRYLRSATADAPNLTNSSHLSLQRLGKIAAWYFCIAFWKVFDYVLWTWTSLSLCFQNKLMNRVLRQQSLSKLQSCFFLLSFCLYHIKWWLVYLS